MVPYNPTHTVGACTAVVAVGVGGNEVVRRVDAVAAAMEGGEDGGDAATVVATAAGGGGFGYCSHSGEVVCGGMDDDDGVRMAAVVGRLIKMGVAVGCGDGRGRDGGGGVESVVGVVDMTWW
ncbi:hypothetical protein Tco_1191808 [Tanacetum coccineum]